jgi:prepilin-type N-terminal cleavage/methylation domain-containing protein
MHKNLKAFTLIELLVVIAIVGILTGFIFVSMNNAVVSAKDAKRKADLANLEKALLAYSTQNNNAYPSTDSYPCTIGTGGTCTNLAASLSPYMNTLPIGPDNDRYTYNYSSGNFTLSGTLSSGPYMYSSSTGAWSNGYSLGQYKEQITIPAAAGAPANYPVKLILNSTSVPNLTTHMAADFHDLRFTDSTGTTQIPYWIESFTAGTTATVWVQVPSIASGATIYMYYGTQAVTGSSGSTTFTSFFDDFPGTSLDMNKWVVRMGSPSYSVSGGVLTTGGNVDASVEEKNFSSSLASATRFRANFAGSTVTWSRIGVGYGNLSNGSNFLYNGGWKLESVLAQPNRVWSGAFSVGSGYNIYEITRPSASSASAYVNDSLVATNTSYIYTSTTSAICIATGTSVNVDWVLVRPYVSTEPSSASLTYGSEALGQ